MKMKITISLLLKNSLISALIFICTLNISGQHSEENDLQKNWKLEKGWFPNKTLVFIETKSEEGTFQFREDNKIAYEIDIYDVECPVGLFTLKEGTWKIEGDFLILELKGLKISDYWYWWKIKYDYRIEKNHMILSVCEILKNKEIPPSKTWEELTKE